MMPSADFSFAGDANAWRKAVRSGAVKAREALPIEQQAAMTVALSTHLEALLTQLSPTALAFCWPYRNEPDLRPLMMRWLNGAASRTALLPVVLEKNSPMLFRRWIPDMKMAHDRHGIPYPSEGPAAQPDVVLVPVNAFDPAGFRLGYGGGYFDRTLARIHPVAIGVGFELGRVDSVRPQSHDRPMDWIVTEKGAFRPTR